MKVLEVLDSFYPSIDGPVNVIVNIAKILNSKKLAEVDLLVPDYPKRIGVPGVNILRCASIAGPEGYRVAIPALDAKIKTLFKKGKYDIVHVHSPFTLGKFIVNLAKKEGIPVLITMHTKYKSDFERKLRDKNLQTFMLNYIIKTVNKADYVLSVSQGAAYTTREYGCNHKDIYIIRNATDLLPAEHNEILEESIKNKYGLKDNFVFLFVGRLVENKNIQFSLEVLNQIKQSGVNNFKFLIVGSGAYENNLKELVKQYNLTENVVFTGKIFDRNTLGLLYKISNLFLFPSSFDTCGIVVIEAATNKLPSVLLENTCASELVTNQIDGYILPEKADVWAMEIKKLMLKPDNLKSVSEMCFKNIYVQWEDVVLQYYHFYQKVLSEWVKPEKAIKLTEKEEKQEKIKRARNIKKIQRRNK